MARWEPDGRGRLERAAMELYVERGFDATTVADIAERAGLTERTFFRHFADKREVLFSGAEDLLVVLAREVAGAPEPAAPIEAVTTALERAGALIQERGEWARRRQEVIAVTAELRERELIKLASMAGALAQALRQRGVKDPRASLTAEAGVAALKVAFERWVEDPSRRDLPRLVRRAVEDLAEVTAPARPA